MLGSAVATVMAAIGMLGWTRWQKANHDLMEALQEFDIVSHHFAVLGGDTVALAHPVAMTPPYYMGKYVVTQKQYQAVMGSNPLSGYTAMSGDLGDDKPVIMVTWNDARDFCLRVNEKFGCKLRLPTEAEWEYACRAGCIPSVRRPAIASACSICSATRLSGVPIGTRRIITRLLRRRIHPGPDRGRRCVSGNAGRFAAGIAAPLTPPAAAPIAPGVRPERQEPASSLLSAFAWWKRSAPNDAAGFSASPLRLNFLLLPHRSSSHSPEKERS